MEELVPENVVKLKWVTRPVTLLHFPAFAKFLLEHHLEAFITDLIEVSRAEDAPLLKFFSSMSTEELVAMSIPGTTDLLNSIVTNSANEFIDASVESWIKNHLPVINREQIVAEDLTVGSLIRRKSFRTFLWLYTSDIDLYNLITEEIDRFTTLSEMASLNALTVIQHENLAKKNHELSLEKAKLEASEKLYKQAQELTHIGNWSWDIIDDKVSWSDEMYRIYNLEPQSQEITLGTFSNFIHPDDRQKRIDQIDESLKTGISADYQIRIICRDGEQKILRGRGEVITGESGEAVRLVGTCQDITEEFYLNKELHDQALLLEYKNLELERSNKELESFNYVASHDLQEPLRKIQTFSNRVLEKAGENLPENTLGYFEKIISSAALMQRLIEDLLAFSQSGATTAISGNVDLNNIVSDVKNSFAHIIDEKNAIVESDHLPVVNVVPFQFVQLFSNLVSNALKYDRAGVQPKIWIRSSFVKGKDIQLEKPFANKKFVAIRISDNGIGFEPEYSEKIFDLFTRLHGKEKYKGTGIGLAICKKIVHNHQGIIRAEGEKGKGAVFSIYLPEERIVTSV